jgi:hypothetical protein
VNEYWRDFFARSELALLVLAYGASAACFFVTLGIAITWLTERGYGPLGDVLVIVYVLSSLPILLAQIGLIVDLLLRFVGETIVVLPALRAVAEKTPAGSATRAIASILTTVSPISSISAWALQALAPSPRAIDLARAKHRTEASLLQATIARLKKSVSR